MDRQTCRWTHHSWTDRLVDVHKDRQICVTHEQMDLYIDTWLDESMYGHMDRQTCICTQGQTDVCMDTWIDGPMYGHMGQIL